MRYANLSYFYSVARMGGHEIFKTLAVFEMYPQWNDTRPASYTDDLKKFQEFNETE